MIHHALKWVQIQGAIHRIRTSGCDILNSICKYIAFLFFIFFPLLATAFSIPAGPQGYVHDAAGILPSGVHSLLDTELREFDAKTSSQVVVAIFKSLEGESLEDLSLRLAETWKIGRKGRDNGVLFLVFLDDRKMRIEVGYGFEGVMTDFVSHKIIRDVVTPHFKAGDIPQGVVAGARAIMQATQGEFADASDEREPTGSWRLQRRLIFGVFGAIVLVLYSLRRLSRSGRGLEPYMTRRGWGGSSTSWDSGGSFGGGGFSGGGGSFGGGGASGSW